MKKFIGALMIFAGIFQAKSQTFDWARSYGSGGLDNGNGIISDASGFVYTTGFYTNSVSFSTATTPITFTTTNEGAYIVKLDSLGNALWAQEFTGTLSERGIAITLDPSGNVLVTGLFTGSIACPTHTLVSAGGIDAFIAKLDISGNFLWAKRIGGTLQDEGLCIKTDPSGNVYVGGRFEGTADFDPGATTYTLASNGGSYDGYLLKLDASGNFLWAVNMFGSVNDDCINAVAIDPTGDPWITGYYAGSGAQTMHLNKRSQLTGAYVWGSAFGGTSSHGTCLSFDSGGNLIMGGYFQGTVNFNPYSGSYNLSSSSTPDDAFIMKIDPTPGTFMWAIRFGSTTSDRVLALSIDQGDNVWATGYFSGPVDFDPGPSAFSLVSSGPNNVFITKLSPSSNFLWAGQVGGSADDSGNSITTDGYKKIYTTGYFKNTADFDPSAASYTLATNSSGNIFVHKLVSCTAAPSLTSAISGTTGACFNTASVYSVTPVTGANYYWWTLPSGWTGSSINPTISAIPSNINGVITLSVSNLCGSSSTQSISVTVHPLPTVAVSSGTICKGQSFTITPNGANTYTYSGGSSVVSPTVTTSYSITGTNTLGGCVTPTQAVITVTVYSLPTITAAISPSIICSGATATLTAGGAPTLTWNTGATGSATAVSPTITTQYTVTGNYLNGCQNSTVKTITVISSPTVMASTSQSLICIGNSAVLTAGGANSYTWSTSATGSSISVSPTVSTQYTVTGINSNSCTNIAVITQSVSNCTGLSENGETFEIIIHPNPSTDKITITTNISGGESILISNSLGQIVYSGKLHNNTCEVDLHELACGFYIVNIGRYKTRILKE